MATYKNKTAYSTGGRLYSDKNILAANKNQQADYFPSSDDTLANLQADAAELANCLECNGLGEEIPTCYFLNQSLDINYLP